MTHDIVGDWDVMLGEEGRGGVAGRLTFFLDGGRLLVRDADPDAAGAVSRVETTDSGLRFEHLSPGSARGTTRHTFDIVLRDRWTFAGTRRRGLLARIPILGRRVPGPFVDPLAGFSPDLAAAKARAAAAAERAALAAAEAEAALAEAEAAAALEAARRAAERAVAARADAVPADPEPAHEPEAAHEPEPGLEPDADPES